MREYLEKVIAGQGLTQEEAASAFDVIMAGDATPAQIGAFLAALRTKGETAEEVAGGASSMRQHAVLIDAGGRDVVDTCGTGGDGSHTINISTLAALVAAGAGVPIAKHGNRSITSKCGSADMLAELGVNLDASPDVVGRCIREAGIGFMFAPRMHPAMKHAMPVRKELGVRTIFNMLGPLTNPARAQRQVLGVFAPELTDLFAHVLQLMGSERAMVVHGSDGMDEITTTGPTRISELRDGAVRTYDLDPADVVGDTAAPGSFAGGDAAANADVARRLLAGETGPGRDIVCLNAAAAIFIGGVASDMAEGWAKAQTSIDGGRAAGVLAKLVEVSNAGA